MNYLYIPFVIRYQLTLFCLRIMYLSKSQMFYRCSTFSSAWFSSPPPPPPLILHSSISIAQKKPLPPVDSVAFCTHQLRTAPPTIFLLFPHSSPPSYPSPHFPSLFYSVSSSSLPNPLFIPIHFPLSSPLSSSLFFFLSFSIWYFYLLSTLTRHAPPLSLSLFLSIHRRFPPACPPPLSSSLSSLLSQSAVTEILQAHSDRDLFHCFLCRQLAVLTISRRIKCYLTLLAGRSSLYRKRKNLKAICFSYENDPLTL